MKEALARHPLDPNSPVPLYHQLKAVIIGMIDSGELEPGGAVPSQNALQRAYGISRNTVREAMAALEREGYISRRRGRNTEVNMQPPRCRSTSIGGFTADMLSQGIKPWSRVLGVSIVSASPELAARLRVKVDDHVIAAHRLRLADGRPTCIELLHLPVALVGSISPADLDGDKSLNTLLRERLGIRLEAVEEVLELAYASPEHAALLEIPPASPIIRIQRVAYTKRQECIEYADSYWRGDCFQYVTWRTGSSHVSIRQLTPGTTGTPDGKP